jgi:hypothetical protein
MPNIGNTIKVVTYSNHDSLNMQVEQFVGNPNRRFQISRPVMNVKYVWVTLIQNKLLGYNIQTFGLINGIDFIILDDNVTIQISDSWNISTNDIVEITSFTAPTSAFSTLGYKIFNDMLGGTTFTRISGKNTTYLTQPLSFTDSEIYVADATILTAPSIQDNISGVIFINGERIEFRSYVSANNNTYKLTEITRATMGTGPTFYLESGTKVIDQGTDQIISNPETTYTQNTFTNTLTNVYIINTASSIVVYPGTTSTAVSEGITLSTSPYISLVDQIEVIYGGRPLRKSPAYSFDTTVSYDSFELDNIIGLIPDNTSFPESPIIGDAYILEDSNEIWLYTGSRSQSTATIGWVNSGILYLPPEFTVTNTGNQQLVLNTATLEVQADIQITIVKKDFSANGSWNTIVSSTSTLSLIDSTTTVAQFLQHGPTDLPNNYYYGGDLILTDEAGEPLVTEENKLITGYY